MLPVYRVRDGFSTIQQNQKTFEATYEVLKKKMEPSSSLLKEVIAW
jgi:hypothetical protein